jgi:hypothetical protein
MTAPRNRRRPLRAQQLPGAGRDRRSPRDGLVGTGLLARESCRGAQTRRAERRCRWHRRGEHQGTAALASSPLAGARLSARCGHLPTAARQEGDDPQALGWTADAGGAGYGGSVDLPGPIAGAHAHLRPALLGRELRLPAGTLGASSGTGGSPSHHRWARGSMPARKQRKSHLLQLNRAL